MIKIEWLLNLFTFKNYSELRRIILRNLGNYKARLKFVKVYWKDASLW